MADKVILPPISSFTNDTTAVGTTNANYTAITTAIDNTLSRDGTQPNMMNTNLDMNSNQILNLPAPISQSSPARLQDLANLQGGSITFSPLPTGGTTGQVLTKNSNANFDASFKTSTRQLLGPAGTTQLFYVNSITGNDSNDGRSPGTAWKTLLGAGFLLYRNYDFAGNQGALIVQGGPYTNDTFFLATDIVGCPLFGLIGNPFNPGSVIIDGLNSNYNGVYLSSTCGGEMELVVDGLQFQNFTVVAALNSQGNGFYGLNNVNFLNCWGLDIEGNGSVEMNTFVPTGISTPTPATTKWAGASNTIGYYANGASTIDSNGMQFVFATGTNFTFAFANTGPAGGLFSIDVNTVSGSPTGTKYFCGGGSIINVQNANGSAQIDPSNMPGSIAGVNNGGFVNGNPFNYTTYTPTVTSFSGTLGSVTATARTSTLGQTTNTGASSRNMCYWQADVTVNNVSTGSGGLSISLPSNFKPTEFYTCSWYNRSLSTGGTGVLSGFGSGNQTYNLTLVGGGMPVGTGQEIVASGFFEFTV